MSIKENINTNIGECVICYAENNTVTNPLCIGKDIIDASCKCKYFVHKRCINEWLNIKKNKPYIFHVLLGISLSVVIYYINNIFNVFGLTNKIPIYLSVFFPIIFLSMISIVGLIRINEK